MRVAQPSPENPFASTKATELDDSEIVAMFVPNERIQQLVNPTSKKPVLLTGGKGAGRTHLLRYWSLAGQMERGDDLGTTITGDGFIGVYYLLGGTNADRFEALAIDEIPRAMVFGFSLDLNLVMRLIGSIADLDAAGVITPEEVLSFSDQARSMLQAWLDVDDDAKAILSPGIGTADLLEWLASHRRTFDRLVSDSIVHGQPLSRSFRLPSVGEILFDVAQAAVKHLSPFGETKISLLLDELENLPENQQRYIQTLIRFRKDPVTLVIGSRTYGVRTLQTLGGEENRETAEFTHVRMDEELRHDEASFSTFCCKVIESRLGHARLAALPPSELLPTPEPTEYFPGPDHVAHSTPISKLRSALDRHKATLRLRTAECDEIANSTKSHDPIATRAGILKIYIAWNAHKHLLKEAEHLRTALRRFESEEDGPIAEMLGHRRSDLVAQLLREAGRPQDYYGLQKYVDAADGNPRSFMNLMKATYAWWEFKEKGPFARTPVPLSVQAEAFRDAADWYWNDCQVIGEHSPRISAAVERFAELISKIRFSAKPSEVSLSSATLDLETASQQAVDAVHTALDWGLLVEQNPRRHRNHRQRKPTVQVNRTLAPLWDLPLARRGIINLDAVEVDSIFGSADRDQFEAVLKERLARTEPPFRHSNDTSGGTSKLFDL